MDDWDLFARLNGLFPTIHTSSSVIIPTTTIAATTASDSTTSTPTIPLNYADQVLNAVNDWNLDAIVNGFFPTIDASLPLVIPATATTFVPTTTTTATIPVNNNQVLDEIHDWGLDAIVNGLYPTINASSSSSAVVIPTTTNTTTFISTGNTIPTIPKNNTFDWNLDATLNGFYPTFRASSSSTTAVTPTTTITSIPAIATTQATPLNNGQMVDGTNNFNLHGMVNGFYPTIGTSSPYITTTTTQIVPKNVSDLQHSSFRVESSHHFQSTNENNNKKFMQFSNNPFNIPNNQKTPLTSKNWPILSIPGFGKISEPSNHQPQQQKQVQGRQQSLHISEGSSKSTKREKVMKRIYKMPPQGLNTDVWSWKKYHEKFVNGSPYARIYYKCDSRDDCKAERRVEKNRSNPNSLTLTYTGQHNHPMSFMNHVVDSTRNYIASSETNSQAATESSEKKKKKKNNDDDIFEGLENFVDL